MFLERTGRSRPGARATGLMSVLVGAVLLAAACSPTASPSPSATGTATAPTTEPTPTEQARGDLLTLVTGGAPLSLNPASFGPGAEVAFLDPMYDSYIYQNADGSFAPGLAESFEYPAGSNNQTFVMTLKDGLAFSDGAELTAQVVVDNILYQKGSGLPTSQFLAAFDTVEATDDLTVEVTTSAPVPNIPLLFSQFYPTGFPVSPAALADPTLMDSASYGIGPYVLDADETVAGDTYVYTPNDTYYDQARIHYEKLVIKIIADANARLQAVKTGQADVMSGSQPTAVEAAEAGLEIYHATARNIEIWLLDRGGTVTPALGDLRVRQALNFAVDREALTQAIMGDYGIPTVQPAIPGLDAYDPDLESMYPYDVDKAKELLADAGYADGFTVSLVTVTPGQQQAQAVAGYWEEIGVTVEFVNDDTFGAQLSGQHATMILFYSGNLDALLSVGVLPNAPGNVFKTQDPVLDELIETYNTGDTESHLQAAKDISRYLTENAWFVPMFNEESIWYARPNVGGVQVTGAWTFLDPKEWFPK